MISVPVDSAPLAMVDFVTIASLSLTPESPLDVALDTVPSSEPPDPDPDPDLTVGKRFGGLHRLRCGGGEFEPPCPESEFECECECDCEFEPELASRFGVEAEAPPREEIVPFPFPSLYGPETGLGVDLLSVPVRILVLERSRSREGLMAREELELAIPVPGLTVPSLTGNSLTSASFMTVFATLAKPSCVPSTRSSLVNNSSSDNPNEEEALRNFDIFGVRLGAEGDIPSSLGSGRISGELGRSLFNRLAVTSQQITWRMER